MTCPSDRCRFLVGIEYSRLDGEMGYFDIERKVLLSELAREVAGYLRDGKSSRPAFPPESNPEVLFAWNLDNPEDGDVYHELMAEIQNLLGNQAA